MANNNANSSFSHEKIETNNFLMIVLILLVLLVGGMVEIVPLFFQKSTTEPISKRTGPDLHRVGGKYSDEWHRVHLINPRDLVPESNMPAYPWLEKTMVDAAVMPAHMKALRTVGVPYTDEQIAKSVEEVKGKTELDATIAYLQVLGLALK